MDFVDRLTAMGDPLEPVDALSSLADATRRNAYAYVAAQGRPVGRDEVAGALGIGRTLAAYHLDRLAKDGLLSVAYARRSGRTGPGAGRPAKLYERSGGEIGVSVPPRDYGVAAQLLAHAAAHDDAGETRQALRDAAGSLGRELAATGQNLEQLLRDRGYEPFDDEGVLRLRNCPFHTVAQSHPEVVCDMNLNLVEGLIAGLDLDVRATLEPGSGRCCVAIRPANADRSDG
jgi:predicted ArsR family transcriptional regulator